MTQEEVRQAILAVPRRCRGPLLPGIRDEVNMLLAQGKTELAARLDEAGRTACGYNVNQLILANPWDGQEHIVTCPWCQQQIVYIAPTVED